MEEWLFRDLSMVELATPVTLATFWVGRQVAAVSLTDNGVDQFQFVEQLVSLYLWNRDYLRLLYYLYLLQCNVPVSLAQLMEEWLFLDRSMAELPTPVTLAMLWLGPLVVLVSLTDNGVGQPQLVKLVSRAKHNYKDTKLFICFFAHQFQDNAPVSLTRLMEEWLSIKDLSMAELATPVTLGTLWMEHNFVTVVPMERGAD